MNCVKNVNFMYYVLPNDNDYGGGVYGVNVGGVGGGSGSGGVMVVVVVVVVVVIADNISGLSKIWLCEYLHTYPAC
jgi:hypothetical protein